MNHANPTVDKKLPNEYARVKMPVITNPDHAALPQSIRNTFDGIIKQLNAKSWNTYPPGAILALLKAVYDFNTSGLDSKHNCYMIHTCDVNTGGIPTGEIDEATGCPIVFMEVFATFLNKALENLENGDVQGARRIIDSIEERKLVSLQHQVQLNLRNGNTRVLNAESFVSTSASILVSPGNEEHVTELFNAVTLMAKAPNLSKHMLREESQSYTPHFLKKVENVTVGENELATFIDDIKDESGEVLRNVKLPHTILNCVEIEENGKGGYNFFFQYQKTKSDMRFWYSFRVPATLSQFSHNPNCCLAMVTFMEYNGIAPVHNIDCSFHTRFQLQGSNEDLNKYIGIIYISKSGFSRTSRTQMDAISRRYKYSLRHGKYPYRRTIVQDPQPPSEETELQIEFLSFFERATKHFNGLSSKEKYELLDSLGAIVPEKEDMAEEQTKFTNQKVQLLKTIDKKKLGLK
ncbi:predicted protein [Chaetoceros tenuissimus]|uniref:Uncharacterized protein n=1 Tax=Chaetoceros tenuissimus TaxID=426638 RepID=A0AAD3CRR2_9STRA|nr:predicted protein [Chaetoceros tenuissimus]